MTALHLRRLAFGLAVVAQLVVLYAPRAPAEPVSGLGLDKLVHAGVFALVAWTGRRAGLPAGPLVAVLLAHAVASEGVQHVLLPHRSGDPWDAVADAVGTLAGTLLGTRGAGAGIQPPARGTMRP